MPCRKVHIIPCLLHRASCRLPKTPLCHKGLPRLSERLAARSNENRFLPPKTCGECLRFRGKGLWQICDSRQHFLATPSRHAGDVQRRRQARKLSLSLALLRVIGIQAEGPFRSKWTANLCGNHGKPSWQSTGESDVRGVQQSRPNRRVSCPMCPSNGTFQYIPSPLQSPKLPVFPSPCYTRIAS